MTWFEEGMRLILVILFVNEPQRHMTFKKIHEWKKFHV